MPIQNYSNSTHGKIKTYSKHYYSWKFNAIITFKSYFSHFTTRVQAISYLLAKVILYINLTKYLQELVGILKIDKIVRVSIERYHMV